MTRLFLCAFLLLGTPMFCQQQNSVPTGPNSQVLPDNSAQTNQSVQPPQNRAAANERIQSNLQSSFDDDPVLSGADLTASVDDERVTLTGTVQSYLQHQRVVQLVSPYSGYREIVDK